MTRPPGHTEETAMHPTISYYLAQAPWRAWAATPSVTP
jgi:hypothetical protein